MNQIQNKQIGIVGLGKMGANLSKRLIERSWQVAGYNRSPEPTRELEKEGLIGTYSLEGLVSKLDKPRILYLLVPAGQTTDEVIKELLRHLDKNDIIVESANSFYKDTVKRGKEVTAKGVRFIDVGISGGPGGARNGACLMVGGDKQTFEYLLPLFTDIAQPNAVQHFEGVGAGHFVKMIHNGIEYGMMQALAEGFDILKESDYKLDLRKVADIYNHGSVIESRLTNWLREGFRTYGVELESISGSAGSGGAEGMQKSEAKWTLDVAKELKIKAHVIEDSVKARLETQVKPSYQGKIINALRNMFGGHKT